MNWADLHPYLLLWLPVPALACVAVWVALWWLVSQHARWFEETELFLDTVEAGIADGLGVGNALAGLAEQHGRAVSPAWHRTVADMQAGRSLTDALDRNPNLLPAPIAGLLKTGEATGEWRAVLAGARCWLQRPMGHLSPWSQGVAEVHYYAADDGEYSTQPARLSPWSHGVMFNAVMIALFGGAVTWLLGATAFASIAVAMQNLDVEPTAALVLVREWYPAVMVAQAVCAAAMVALSLACLGGPQLGLWLERLAPARARAWLQALPWRRRRAVRDFSVMLAALLDAGANEEAALRQAAAWTDSTGPLRAGAAAAIAELRAGVWLPEALRHLDGDEELHWRTTLAVTRAGGFGEALRGWQESLEARAQQQEAMAGGAVLLWGELANGLLVALLAGTVFGVLVAMVDMTWLW